jgi:hypothetical protein
MAGMELSYRESRAQLTKAYTLASEEKTSVNLKI